MDINKIKEKANAMLKAVGLEVVFKAESVKLMAEGKLEDGTIVATPADAFAEGVEVFVVVEGQEPVPAPDGEHTLESGEVITVKEGKIVSIMAKSSEKEEETEMENVLKPLVDRIAALEEANQTQAADLKKATDEATSLRKQLADTKGELAKLSKSKGTESVIKTQGASKNEQKAVEKVDLSKMSTTERVAYYAKKTGALN